MPIPVGNLTTFGLSKEEALKQIWQMLVDSRDGTAPFHVTTGAPSNTSNDGVSIGITPEPAQFRSLLYQCNE